LKDPHAYLKRISDAFLNQTVLALRGEKGTVYMRVSEIEFYLNDFASHEDTFTHADEMQRETGKWYFHRYASKTYKAGTYKGLDLAIGKGKQAVGGILIRSLMPTMKAVSGSLSTLSSKKDFVEGPCNCVNRILREVKPASFKGEFDIKDLVKLPDFSLDSFDKTSRVSLVDCAEAGFSLEQKDLASCPRVGLTLKRYDEKKEKLYWMANYRFLIFPKFHAKMKDFINLSYIQKGKTVSQVCQLTDSKSLKVEELKAGYERGVELGKERKTTIKASAQEKMTTHDWAFVYGLHQGLNLP